MNIQNSFKKVKNHEDYSFNAKDKFTNIQLKFFGKISIYAFIFAFILLGIAFFSRNNYYEFACITTTISIALIILFLAIYIDIKCPPMAVLLLPILNALLICYVCSIFQPKDKGTYFCCILACILLYSIHILIVPVNIIRELNPMVSIVGGLISFVTQIIVQSKDIVFDLMTKSSIDKIQAEATDLSWSDHIENSRQLVVEVVKHIKLIQNYIIVKNVNNDFDNQIIIVTFFLTIMFTIYSAILLIRITINDQKAEEIWQEIVFKYEKPSYRILNKCAYYGGQKYENLILSNSIYQDIIKRHSSK